MDGYRELDRFTSRNNKVSIVEKVDTKTKYILKLYPNHMLLEKELRVMRSVQGKLRIPKVIKATDRELLLEFVNGRTVLQELIDGPMFKVNMLAGSFAKYLKELAEETHGALEEVSLCNYIMKGSIIYGYDFVTLDEGDTLDQGEYEDMIADVIALVLLEKRIVDMRKSVFVREFLRNIGFTTLYLKDRCINRLNKLIAQYKLDEDAESMFKKIG